MEIDSLEFDKICRACLGNKGEMRSIYGSCLDNMLRSVAHVDIQPDDGLPELMCLQCTLQVSRAFRFIQQCERSDATLRNLLSIAQKEDLSRSNHCDNKLDEYIVGNDATQEDLRVFEHFTDDQEGKSQEDAFAGSQICEAFEIVLNDVPINAGAYHPESQNNKSITDSLIQDDTANASEITDSLLLAIAADANDQNKGPTEMDIGSAGPFQCPICSKEFSKRRIWKRHLKIHNPIKPHQCEECGMSFTESSNLKKHIKKHTGELRNVVGKPNLCLVCGKSFKWASSLSKHMNHHTKKKILNCPHCPKYYVESRSLRIHLRTHTGEKPFVCSVCNKGFTQMCNLEKHLRVHTGEKPFLCPVCGKGFSQSGYVSVHLRSHTGEKPYVCTECGKSFAGSNSLNIHKKIHSGEKPFACDLCKKAFSRQESLSIHYRTHTGEKSHTCSICSRGFTCVSHLTIHMRTHTGEKPYSCKLCPRKFISCNSLKAHVRTHSKDILDSNAIFSATGKVSESAIVILQNETNSEESMNNLAILTVNESI